MHANEYPSLLLQTAKPGSGSDRMWHMCMILGRPSQAAGPLVILDLQLAHSLCRPASSLLRLIFRTSLQARLTAPLTGGNAFKQSHNKRPRCNDYVCFLPCRQGKPFSVPQPGHAWDAKGTDLYTTDIKACLPDGRKPVWEGSADRFHVRKARDFVLIHDRGELENVTRCQLVTLERIAGRSSTMLPICPFLRVHGSMLWVRKSLWT